MWHVYIIKCVDNSFYTGITNNLEKRIKAHEHGKGAKYTKGRGPFELLAVWSFPNKSEASKREYQIKQLSKKEKLKLINGYLK